MDRTVIQILAERLDLDLACRIGALLHGNRQKLGTEFDCIALAVGAVTTGRGVAIR